MSIDVPMGSAGVALKASHPKQHAGSNPSEKGRDMTSVSKFPATMPEHPATGGQIIDGPRRHIATADEVSSVAMGPLELKTYRECWLASSRFRRRDAEVAAERDRERAINQAEKAARIAIEKAMRTGKAPTRSKQKSGHSASRHPVTDFDDEDPKARSRRTSGDDIHPPNAGAVAASLMLARSFDRRPALLESLRNGAPVVLIDVADVQMLDHVAMIWRSVLFESTASFMDLAQDPVARRKDLDAVYLVAEAHLLRASHRSRRQRSRCWRSRFR
ncbi:hypothetical protein [Bradyrhizobium genosp. P]|uniref:hypothetical protein n=1 Tax=Bradyrhizobium genosp. P TaxID=83641 RepID=UPI003CEC07B2